MAPASLISLFVAPVAGRMTDKIGGKYILMSGLTLFGAGMGWLALIAHPNSNWPSFLAPLVVAGLGMGCIFAPLVTTAMRNIPPQLAGAASGVLNTVRQVGLVIGTAAVGALLQNRLVSSMTGEASARAGALPPQVRDRFVTQIHNSANNGIQVGAGQNGGSTHQIPGRPAGPGRRDRTDRPRRVHLRLRDGHEADDDPADRPARRRRAQLPGDQGRRSKAVPQEAPRDGGGSAHPRLSTPRTPHPGRTRPDGLRGTRGQRPGSRSRTPAGEARVRVRSL